MENVRIDKWLWAARFFKTRSRAKNAINSGKIKRDGEGLKPSAMVKLGEILKIRRGNEQYEVVINGLSDKRCSAPIAQQLYKETADSIAQREKAQLAKKSEPTFDQRWDKNQRRERRAFKTNQ